MAKSGKLEVANTFIADATAGEVGVFGEQAPQQNLALNQLLDARVAAIEALLASFGYTTTSGSPPADPVAWGQIGGTLGNQTDLVAALDDAAETSIQANGGSVAAFPTINFSGTGVSRSGNTIVIDSSAGLGLLGQGARVRKTGTQNITSGTQIAFNTVDFDDASIGAGGTGPITIPAGVTRAIITAQIVGQKFSPGVFSFALTRNGSTFASAGGASFSGHIQSAPVTLNATLTTGIINVAAGQVFGLQGSTGAGTHQVQANTWINMVVLRES